jgi:CheY-like chemotaxis protein
MHTVMVVEDERELLILYKMVLEKQGYFVLAAQDGQQALALLEEYQPALIFLDIHLPLIDGLQILRYIRSRERFSHTRVVLNSSMADYGRELWHEHDEFFQKPLLPTAIMNIAARKLAAV